MVIYYLILAIYIFLFIVNVNVLSEDICENLQYLCILTLELHLLLIIFMNLKLTATSSVSHISDTLLLAKPHTLSLV